MEYNDFLESKKHKKSKNGIDCVFYPENIFDFQKHIIDHCARIGRCAGFIDTGLGKTIVELTIAHNHVLKSNKPVLIVTPLAVAFQFIKEAEKFGIPDVEYSKDGKFTKKIIICNYERLHCFDKQDFSECVICDESSILKNFEGETKNAVNQFLRNVNYRYLFTATPSPNDYMELGNSSECLGNLGYMDMLNKYFKNNNNNTCKISEVDKARRGMEWYLKPHAEKDFWQWVSSWSITVRKPSDIGFSDEKYILPDLIETQHVVKNNSQFDINGQMCLFNFPATSFKDIKKEVRDTIKERCEKAVELASNHECSVYWANLNDESSLIKKLDKSSVEIRGDISLEEKEDILINFSQGFIKKLITKTSITAFGLNWQHCNHTSYFPTYSFERYYQAVRRFWRFGQKRHVYCDLVLSDGQTEIMNTVIVKKNKAEQMFDTLVKSTSVKNIEKNKFINKLQLPSFLGVN